MAWQRRMYRGNKAWVRMAPGGVPVRDDRGLAPLRYKLSDARDYTVRPEDLGRLPAIEDGPPDLTAYLAVAPDGAAGIGVLLRLGAHEAEVAERPPAGAAPDGRAAFAVIEGALRDPRRPVVVVSALAGPRAPSRRIPRWAPPANEAEEILLARAERIAKEAAAAHLPESEPG